MLDALIVGASPTGLTLAAGLARFGVQFRVIDRTLDRVHESRALGVQARSLEVLQSLGLGEVLVRRGNASARLLLHLDQSRTAEARLGDFGVTDTRFPFILFVSQAETEAVLGDHLASMGVMIERGVELLDAMPEPDCVRCLLRHLDGMQEQARVRFLTGCDGAHSTVRQRAGVSFEGDAYLQDFMLGDVEVDGLSGRDALHSFAVGRGIAMFFPLGSPTTWRVIAASGNAPGQEHPEKVVGRRLRTSQLRRQSPATSRSTSCRRSSMERRVETSSSAIRRGSATSGCIIARPLTIARVASSWPATRPIFTVRSAHKE